MVSMRLATIALIGAVSAAPQAGKPPSGECAARKITSTSTIYALPTDIVADEALPEVPEAPTTAHIAIAKSSSPATEPTPHSEVPQPEDQVVNGSYRNAVYFTNW